jgi:pyridoxal phosphate enzyme, YggS family
MHNIPHKITQVTTRIEKAALHANRNPQDITLLAVSKRQPEDAILEAYRSGLRHFGENYVQEALAKIERLKLPQAVWHFIGPIQSNKTSQIAEHFHWVHAIERLKIARRLSEQRNPKYPPLNVCLQINIDNETTKAGVTPEDAEALALQITELPNLNLRGLMAIPLRAVIPQHNDDAFTRMKQLFKRLKKHDSLSTIDTLSMGMSTDMESAIQQGATIVRVGTALFGPRTN